MELRTVLKRSILTGIVFLIAALLLVNAFLIYRNSLIIKHNKNLQEEAERIKVNTIDLSRNLHLLDLGIRSYALIKKPRFFAVTDSAGMEEKRIFKRIEEPLLSQHFPMHDFYALRDSMNNYHRIVSQMRNYLLTNQLNKFIELLNRDPGYDVWLQHQKFSQKVISFEDQISKQARARYEQALTNSYLLQIILFLITLPTVAYSAYHASRALKISEQLRKSEEANNQILSKQNVRLEEMVRTRTQEIHAQNVMITAQSKASQLHNDQLVLQQKEIQSQRNALVGQNEELKLAKQTIEKQNVIIQLKNEELVLEVGRQTQDLKKTNLELIEHNNRLEQFAYIISHNLRAPMTRIVGLAGVFEHAKSEEEISNIIKMMVESTTDLDQIIKDLARILEIQRLNTQTLNKVILREALNKSIGLLKREIEETQTKLIINLKENVILNSLEPYIESIFYNLISNAIKYRHPDRVPMINVLTRSEGGYVIIEVSDNGLGINLEKYSDKLFTLYKRFHFHVEGKGLGLYLIKTQVNALEGKIEVRSKIDEGTTFIIYLKN